MTVREALSDEKRLLKMIIAVLAIALSAIIAYSFPGKSEAPPHSLPNAVVAAASAPEMTTVHLTPAAQQEANLGTTEIVPRTDRAVVLANGQVVLNENETWHVGSLAEGKVTQILANVGDRVKKDQILAFLHSHVVHETRAAHSQALAELDRAVSQRDFAKRSADRAQRLLTLQAISEEQADTTKNDLRSAEAAVKKAEAGVEKERLHLTEFLEVNAESPARKITQDDSDADSVPIRAPFSGTIIRRQVSVGGVLSVGQEAFTIANLSSLWVIAAVNEADLAAVRAGVAARVSVRAFPDRSYVGRVLQLGTEMDAATRALKVRIAVHSPAEELKPEMFAQVEIDTPSIRPALYLPDSAIEEAHGQRVAFVQTGPQSFERRVLTLGLASDRHVEVTSGIQAGEKVVTRGAFVLKSELLKSRLQGE